MAIASARDAKDNDSATAELSDRLAPALAGLHEAICKQLNGHPECLSLYNRLYTNHLEVLLEKARTGTLNRDSIVNGILATEKFLVTAWGEEKELSYHADKERKQALFMELMRFYKAVIGFEMDLSNALMTVHYDRIAKNTVEDAASQFNRINAAFVLWQREMIDEQKKAADRIAELITENNLLAHPVFARMQREIQRQLDEFKKYKESRSNELRGLREDPEKALQLVQKTIDEVEKHIVEAVALDEKDLSAEAVLVTDIARDLRNIAEKKLSVDLISFVRHLKQTDSYLQGQEQDLKQGEKKSITVEFPQVDDVIPQVVEQVKNQAPIGGIFYSSWYSDAAGSILHGLKAVKSAIDSLIGLQPISKNSVDSLSEFARQRFILKKTLDTAERAKQEAESLENKTQQLQQLFADKKVQLQALLSERFQKLKREREQAVKAALSAEKAAYLTELNALAAELRQTIQQQQLVGALAAPARQSHLFRLPTALPMILAGIASTVLGLGTVAGAAAFALKASVITGLLAVTPVGWLIGAGVAALGLCIGAGILFAKAYNRYVKNQLLARYDAAHQQVLFEQNEILKELGFTSTTRHLMMRYGIKAQPVAKQAERVACGMLNKGESVYNLFLDVRNKRLIFSGDKQTPDKLVSANDFEKQVRHFTLHT